jgi:serine/threonine-protein kinase
MHEPGQKLQLGTAADEFTIAAVLAITRTVTTYKAVSQENPDPVLLMTVNGAYAEDSQAVKQWLKAAEAIAAIDHAVLLNVRRWASISAENQKVHPYILAELPDGERLAELLSRGEQLTLPRFQELFDQIMDGLTVMHKNGIIHGRLQADSIYLTTKDKKEAVTLIAPGFIPTGNKKQLQQDNTQDNAPASNAYYLSPEACRNEPLTASADLYSLGCIMYHALAGKPPFAGSTELDTMYKHLYQVAPPISEPGRPVLVPRSVEAAILRTMDKNPRMRFESVGELKSALTEAFAGFSSEDMNRLVTYRLGLPTLPLPSKLRFFMLLLGILLGFFVIFHYLMYGPRW